MSSITLVVSLWINQLKVSDYEEYERIAAGIMSGYGGRFERIIRLQDQSYTEMPFEIHIISFPSEDALQQYRDDPRYRELQPVRDKLITRTEILSGREIEPYI